MRGALIVVVGSLSLVLGCGDDPIIPESMASIRVTATTAGEAADLDPDGYTVAVDSRFADRIAANGSLTISDLTPGEHTVTVGGTDTNCDLTSENPRVVTAVVGQTERVDFSFACVPRRGSIRTAASTTGNDIDPNGYTITVLTQTQEVVFTGRIGSNAEITLSDIPGGSLRARLSDIAANCSVNGPNPQDVVVRHLTTAAIGFDVVCLAPLGLDVSIATTGTDLDSDGYAIVIQRGTEAWSVEAPVNGSVALRDLSPGQYTISLTGVAVNCDVMGANPGPINGATGGTVAVHFDVTCVEPATLAFVSAEDGDAEIYLVLANGTGLTRLTDNAANDRDPAWSPDGQRLVFSSDRDGNEEIYVMAADGTGVTRLTNDAARDAQPAWSPDGTTILFASERDGNSQLYTMAPDGTGLARLTHDPTQDSNPDWSPDGSRIAFVRDERIHVMAADGTGVRRLTSFDPYYYYYPIEAQPDWSPDGVRIAYAGSWCGSYYDPADDCSPTTIEVVNATGSSHGTVGSGDWAGEPAWHTDGRTIAFSVDECSFHPSQCGGGIRAVRLGLSGLIDIVAGASPAWRP